jgi:2-amino-4-hydroxy-6-hydroxymethyldihydropteridine diphosphokinase
MRGAPVAVGIGSNEGEPCAHVAEAVQRLGGILAEARASRVYRTAPMYVTEQADFANAVLVGRARLGPYALVRAFKQIERDMGRTSGVRNGPRPIDLDLLAYGSLCLRGVGLQVPHARALERRFVVEPWLEVADADWEGPLRQALASPPVAAQRATIWADADVPVRGR